MKIITFDEIRSLNIQPEQCYDWVNEMISKKRESFLPAKIHMNMEGNRFCNVMPGLVKCENLTYGGIKVVTRYPERSPALDSKLLLFNADSGEFLALMDADWITAMRTGAVASHAVMNLAKNDSNTIGFIGLGNTARATVLVLASKIERDLEVKLLRYKDQAERFMDRFREYTNLHFTIVDTIDQAVKGSDVVISCATYFSSDVCSDDCFDEGVLVVPVHTRGFTNCDLFFDKVYADDQKHVCDFKNFSKFKFFAEMCDVVNGVVPGRESDKERILAYNIGIALHDIFYAANIYRKYKETPVLFSSLQDIDLCEPSEKFWV